MLSALIANLPKEKLHIFLDAQRLPSLEGSPSLSYLFFPLYFLLCFASGFAILYYPPPTPLHPSETELVQWQCWEAGTLRDGLFIVGIKLLGSDPAPQDFSLLFIHLHSNFLP